MDCKFFLYSATEPVIEASRGLTVGCYAHSYFGIASQFESAKLDCWNNKWSEVFDFTPPEGCGNKTSTNWKPMAMSAVNGEAAKAESGAAVPVSRGAAASAFAGGGAGSALLFACGPGANRAAILSRYLKWAEAANNKDRAALVRSRVMAMDSAQAAAAFKGVADRKAAAALCGSLGKGGGVVLVVEFNVEEGEGEAGEELKRIVREGAEESVWTAEGEEAEEPCRYLFSFFKEEQ